MIYEPEDEVLDDEEIVDDEVEETEEDSFDEADESEGEEQTDEADEPDEPDEEPESEEQKDKVPIKTHLKIKKKYRELKKQLAEMKEKEQTQDLISYQASKKKKYIDMGYDEEYAESIAEDLSENRALAIQTKTSSEEDIYLEEIKDLELEGFNDALEHKDKIIELIKKGKKLGEDIDVEEAYLMAKRTTKSNVTKREIQTRIEQQEAIKRRKSGVSNKVASSASKPKGYGLSAEDKKLLKQMQKDFPDGGWTPKKLSEAIRKNQI